MRNTNRLYSVGIYMGTGLFTKESGNIFSWYTCSYSCPTVIGKVFFSWTVTLTLEAISKTTRLFWEQPAVLMARTRIGYIFGLCVINIFCGVHIVNNYILLKSNLSPPSFCLRPWHRVVTGLKWFHSSGRFRGSGLERFNYETSSSLSLHKHEPGG